MVGAVVAQGPSFGANSCLPANHEDIKQTKIFSAGDVQATVSWSVVGSSFFLSLPDDQTTNDRTSKLLTHSLWFPCNTGALHFMRIASFFFVSPSLSTGS